VETASTDEHTGGRDGCVCHAPPAAGEAAAPSSSLGASWTSGGPSGSGATKMCRGKTGAVEARVWALGRPVAWTTQALAREALFMYGVFNVSISLTHTHEAREDGAARAAASSRGGSASEFLVRTACAPRHVGGSRREWRNHVRMSNSKSITRWGQYDIFKLMRWAYQK
jgi:hypothetical protein